MSNGGSLMSGASTKVLMKSLFVESENNTLGTMLHDYTTLVRNILNKPDLYKNLIHDFPDLLQHLRQIRQQIIMANETYPAGQDVEWKFLHSLQSDANSCVELIEIYPDPMNTVLAMLVFGIIYGHIFLLGLLGNISMMLLTLKYRHLQTVQNIFLFNLAMSDVIVCLLSVPITPITNIFKVWYFGALICHLLPFVQAVSVFVSTFSLSAIAIDRYNLVVRPHANILKPKGAATVAIILWLFSAAVSLPYCYYMKMEKYPGYCGQFCSEHWPHQFQFLRRGYALVLLCFQFLIPFAIMTGCYSKIFSHLKERANSKIKKLDERSQLLDYSRVGTPEDRSNGNTVKEVSSEDRQIAQLLSKQRRTTTILASMVLIFALSWLPQNVITLIIEYDESLLNSRTTNYTYFISSIGHCIAMTNNVANPFLYAWLNPSFKEIMIKMCWNSSLHSTVSSSELTNVTRNIQGEQQRPR